MATTGNTSNVVSWKPSVPSGGVLKGTSKSVIPTDATTPLDETFKPLGYVSDKGVSLKPNVSTTKKKAWGGSVIKVLTTDASAELGLALSEFLSSDALRAVFGEENVVVTPATAEHGEKVSLIFRGELPEIAPFVIEGRDGKKRVRVVIPALQVSDQGDFVFDDNSTMDMDIKGEAFKDPSGALFYVYTDDGVTTA